MASHHERFLSSTLGFNRTSVSRFLNSGCPNLTNPNMSLPFFSASPAPLVPSSEIDPLHVKLKLTHHLSLRIIIFIVAADLASAFLILILYSTLLKYFSNRRTPVVEAAPPDDTHEDHDQELNPLDLIWYVRTVGLDESVIESITVCKYKRGEGLIDGTECAVCLNDFREDEHLRLLPKCSHAFHVTCIDTWFKSHVNCPLCRASVAADPAIPSTTSAITSHSMEEGEPQAENFQNLAEVAENVSRDIVAGEDIADATGTEPDRLASPHLNMGFQEPSDLIGKRQ